jgi:hypothetical protein
LKHHPHSENKKKPEVLGKSAGPKLRMNTARKDEFARAETNCIVKSTGMTNRETQTGMLSHFQKNFKNRSGFALHENAWHTTKKKKKKTWRL